MAHHQGAPRRTGARLRRYIRTRPALNRVLAPTHRFLMLQASRRAARRYMAENPLSPAKEPIPGGAPRILVDACAFQEVHGGIARLWRCVFEEWASSGFGDHVVVLDRSRTAPRFDGIRYLDVDRLRAHDDPSERRLLEHICRSVRADLFVSTWYTVPEHTSSAIYVYDMIPEVLGCDLREPMHRDKNRSIGRAKLLICLSENTESDLRRFRPDVAQTPSRVVLPGLEPRFRPASPEVIDEFCNRIGLPRGFFVFLGNRDNYKNAELLFKAAGISPRSLGRHGVLFVGGEAELDPRHATAMGDVPWRVHRLSDEDLVTAYSAASALLFLSRYEGFGLPVTEAMACGCPVIASETPVVVEAAGGAALLVDPDDPAALAARLEEVVRPQVRADLIERGRARVEGLTWAATAQRLAGLLQDAARD